MNGGSVITFCGAKTTISRTSFATRYPVSSWTKNRGRRSSETSAAMFSGKNPARARLTASASRSVA